MVKRIRLNEDVYNMPLNPQEIWNEIQDLDEVTTRWYEVADDGKNIWALVFARMDYDYDDNGGARLHGKVAYCSKRSMMQDYDMDWVMPYDKNTYDVDATELMITSPEDIKWLISEWNRMKNEYDFDDSDYD